MLAALVLEGTAGDVRFSHFLSTETSTGGGDAESVRAFVQQQADSGRSMPATLFLAGGSSGTPNGVFVASLYERIRDRVAGMTVTHMGFTTTHVGTDVPAFEEALRRHFP